MATNATFEYLSYFLEILEAGFHKIPGSQVLARYVKSSHQNDPGRTLLEVILLIFAIRTLLQSRTRADNSGKHFIQFSEKVHMCPFLHSVSAPTDMSSPGNRRTR
jgi:serine palmitoyltransferase